MLNNDRIIAAIRTGVPALVGLILARLIALVPAVADVLAWLDQAAGVEIAKVLELIATAAVIVVYYSLVRVIAKRWPWVEGFLGSTKTPVEYVAASTVAAQSERSIDEDSEEASAGSEKRGLPGVSAPVEDAALASFLGFDADGRIVRTRKGDDGGTDS